VGATFVVAALDLLGVVETSEEDERSDGSQRRGGNEGSGGGGERDRKSSSRWPLTRVVRVIDGDTVETDKQGRVRLIGVDTPEEGRCNSRAATSFTRRRLLGQEVGYELGAERKLAIFSTVPTTELLRWTYRDRYPHSDNFEIPLREYGLSAEDVRQRVENWQAGSGADAVVVIDIAPDSPHYLPLAEYSAYRQIPEVISSNPQFSLSRRWDLPAHRCTITMWTRK